MSALPVTSKIPWVNSEYSDSEIVPSLFKIQVNRRIAINNGKVMKEKRRICKELNDKVIDTWI
jgi:hypothetical protein